MGNQPTVLRRVARKWLKRYFNRNFLREERAKLARHNKQLNKNVSWREITRSREKFYSSVDEYFYFEFYDKTDEERNEYLTLWRQDEITRRIGDICESVTLFRSKILFNALFEDFLNREWCNPSACDAQEFVDFVSRHGAVIVKPSNMSQGTGIYAFTHKSDQDTLALYEKLRGRNLHVEEIIKQHPAMAAFNKAAVATVRIATYADTDDVHVVAAALRTAIREDTCTDNLHSGGCACPVDPETGVVINNAYNSDMERFDVHPLSGIRFIGFQIPFWDQALSLVRAAARRAYAYNCHWVGWDVSFTPDGVTLIEGNCRQGTQLLQTGSVGLYARLLQLSRKL